MKSLYRAFFVVGACMLGSVLSVSAQTKLTDKDVLEIQSKAKSNIADLENLLNFVTFSDASPAEVQQVIERSYASSPNQLFFNKKVVLEDDIDPSFNKDNTKDLEVSKYLNTLDVYYRKTAEPSIRFTSVQVSNVKKKDFLYVKVYFESNFGSAYKSNGSTYQKRQRLALVRADKISYRWEVRIIGVTFYDPFKPITSTENDVTVVTTNPYEDSKQQDISYDKKDFDVKSGNQRPFNVGAKIGFNGTAWVANALVDNPNTSYADVRLTGRSGGVYGLYVRYYGGYKNFGFGADLLYITKGSGYEIQTSATATQQFDFRLSYFQVPLFVNFFFVQRDRFKPYLNLGYAPAFLLNARLRDVTGTSGSDDVPDWFTSVQGNIIIGLGADFKVSQRNRMTFDMRFDLGTGNILGDGDNNVLRNSLTSPQTLGQGTFSLSLGYAFGL
ncbi:MAG: PorT family protein [Cytophagales bacterium]|nr:PorT family protein [Cytophagales bacterium]